MHEETFCSQVSNSAKPPFFYRASDYFTVDLRHGNALSLFALEMAADRSDPV